MLHVIVRVIEGAAEKWNWVVASGAESGGRHASVSLHRNLARFTNRRQVDRIVERRETMNAVHPGVMHIFMALETVLIVVKNVSGNKVAGDCASQRGEEVLITSLIAFDIPGSRVLRLHHDHDYSKPRCDCRPRQSQAPTNPLACKPM